MKNIRKAFLSSTWSTKPLSSFYMNVKFNDYLKAYILDYIKGYKCIHMMKTLRSSIFVDKWCVLYQYIRFIYVLDLNINLNFVICIYYISEPLKDVMLSLNSIFITQRYLRP